MLRKDGTLIDAVSDSSSPILESDSDATQLGTKLRTLRKSKGMSLSDLAKATGLSIGYLSQVERDKSNPSVKILHDVSRALGVNITWFFSGDGPTSRNPNAGPIVRLHDRKQIRYGIDIVDGLLTPVSSRHIELIWSEFKPGSSSGMDPYQHEGEEAGVVLSGVLDLTIGEETHRLEAGDSFGFESTKPHRYENPGDTLTIVLWAVTPPTY